MNQKWISVAVACSLGLGLMAVYSLSIGSLINQIKYDVLSYQVQSLDNVGITLRFMFVIKNPTNMNLDVWQQKYTVFVAGTKVSEVTASGNYRIIANNNSVIPLDVRFTWDDIQNKFPPLLYQSGVTNLKDLPVLVKGTLSAKLGILKVSRIPFRTVMPLAYFLPY